MARIRTIKPEFWSSEQVVELSPTARLLFIGLWNFCDDGGNHPASPRTLKMEVFPGDDFTAEQIGEYVQEMISASLIIEYQDNAKPYWHVTGWHHQKIEKPNYKHPAPKFADQSPTSRRPIDPVRESKGIESKGKEGSGSLNAHAHEAEENQKTEKPLPDQLIDTICAWVETDAGIQLLKKWKRDTGYSDRTHGPTTAELRKFIAYHLQKHRDKLTANPVTHFTEQFPGWLANATQFNRPKNKNTTPDKPRWEPPPNGYKRTANASPTVIGDLTGKVITTIAADT